MVNKSVFLKAGLIALITVLLDAGTHFYFSHPFETIDYFGLKFGIAFIVAILVYPKVKKDLQGMVIGATIFALAFQTVYVINDNIPFVNLTRAVEVFGITGGLEVGIAFFFIHLVSFLVGIVIVKRFLK